MLDAYIIDQIKKREEERRRKDAERPRLEIPVDNPARRSPKNDTPSSERHDDERDHDKDKDKDDKKDTPDRGVVIIEVRQ